MGGGQYILSQDYEIDLLKGRDGAGIWHDWIQAENNTKWSYSYSPYSLPLLLPLLPLLVSSLPLPLTLLQAV